MTTTALEGAMCNCKQEIQDAMAERLKKSQPEAENVSARLEGYGLAIAANQMRAIQLMKVSLEYDAPMKKGGMKRKKDTLQMAASYCMFCGEKYETDAA